MLDRKLHSAPPSNEPPWRDITLQLRNSLPSAFVDDLQSPIRRTSSDNPNRLSTYNLSSSSVPDELSDKEFEKLVDTMSPSMEQHLENFAQQHMQESRCRNLIESDEDSLAPISTGEKPSDLFAVLGVPSRDTEHDIVGAPMPRDQTLDDLKLEGGGEFRQDVINILEEVCSKFVNRRKLNKIPIGEAIRQGMALEPSHIIDFGNPESYLQMQWCMPKHYSFTMKSLRPFAVPLASLGNLDRGPLELSQKLDWQRLLCYNPQRYSAHNTYGFAVGLTHFERYALGEQPFHRLKIPLGYATAHSYLSSPVSVQCPVFRQRVRALTTPPTGRNFGNFLASAEAHVFDLPRLHPPTLDTKTIELFVFLTGKDGLVFDNVADMWKVLRVVCDRVDRTPGASNEHDHTDCLYDDICQHKGNGYAFPLRNKFTEGCSNCVTSLATDFPNFDRNCVRCPRRIISATHTDHWNAGMSPKTQFISFLMVEYPGYGDSQGDPNRDNFIEHTVKSVLESVRRLRSDVVPEFQLDIEIRLNFYAFSLGCAVALSTIECLQYILQTEWMSPVQTLNSSIKELMSCPKRVPPKNTGQLTGAVREDRTVPARLVGCVLLAPFLSTRKMAQEILQLIPGILPRWVTGGKMQRAFIDWMIKAEVDWDNAATVQRIADNCASDPWKISEELSIAILHGSEDEVVPSEQSKTIIETQLTYCIVNGAQHCSLSSNSTFLPWLMGVLR